MPHAVADAPLKTGAEQSRLRSPTAVIIATDGTSQSDAAVALAGVLPIGSQANVPVLVVKPPVSFIGSAPRESVGRIVVPLDGSALAEQILPEVAALALRLNSTVSLLHVLTPETYSQKEIMQPGLPWWDSDIAVADAYLARAASYFTEEGVTVSRDVLLSSDIVTAILDYAARTGADIIAIATRGSGGVTRFMFGTVADEVTRKSPSSLLVFHPKGDDAANSVAERSTAETMAGG